MRRWHAATPNRTRASTWAGLTWRARRSFSARTIGWNLELLDVKVQTLVPYDLAGLPLADFLERLPELDDDFAEQAREAAATGATLRYAAELKDGRGDRRRAGRRGWTPRWACCAGTIIWWHTTRDIIPTPRSCCRVGAREWMRQPRAFTRTSWRWPHKEEVDMAAVAAPSRKIKVGILGATGAVGQRFVQLLADHPWFEVAALTASDRSVGKAYGEAAKWLIRGGMPAGVGQMRLAPTEPDSIDPDVKLLFSAIPGGTAGAGRKRAGRRRFCGVLERLGAPDG